VIGILTCENKPIKKMRVKKVDIAIFVNEGRFVGCTVRLKNCIILLVNKLCYSMCQ